MKKSVSGIIVVLTAATAAHAGGGKSSPTVVFVCEHGAAKSVVAAAHFNRLARERGLRMRAIARGTVPDERMAPVAVSRPVGRDSADERRLRGRPRRDRRASEGAARRARERPTVAPAAPPRT